MKTKSALFFAGVFMAGTASAWTYAGTASTGTITADDGSGWVLDVSQSSSNLTITKVNTASTGTGHLDLSVPVNGGRKIISIGANTATPFRNNSYITSVVLPEDLQQIRDYAFYDCPALTNVTPFLPETLRTVGTYAFGNCKLLEGDLVLSCPDLETVGQNAFPNTRIKSVDMSASGVKTIGQAAFGDGSTDNPYLKTVILSPVLETIGVSAFRSCSELTSVTPFLPKTVKTIRTYAFMSCKSLAGDLVLACPESKSLEGYAFQNTKINSVFFGEGSSNLTASDYIFSGCLSITQLVFSAEVPAFRPNANPRTFEGWASMQAIVCAPRGSEGWEELVENGGISPNVIWSPTLTTTEQSVYAANFPGGKTPHGKIKLPMTQPQGIYQAFRWYNPPGAEATLIIVR